MHGKDRSGAEEHNHDHHGNPQDHEGYLAKLLDPERTAWQKPDEVVEAIGLEPGDIACEIGSGPGVFSLRLAKAVGNNGRVHAIDVDPRMIAILETRAKAESVTNLTTHLAQGGRGLPPEPVDRILLVNTFHHFAEPATYLGELKACLKPGGRIVNVDFHKRELPVGPPLEHRVSREDFLAVAREVGLELKDEKEFLPYQYLLVLG